jgi:FkbM family methyltransferase
MAAVLAHRPSAPSQSGPLPVYHAARMGSRLQAGRFAVRRTALSAAKRLGRERQLREILGRLREARSAFNSMERQELRDEHALRVVLTSVLRPDSNAVDVGANEGAVLDAIVHLAPEGLHLAFEPIPQLFERLASRFPAVDVRRAALSDTAGVTSFAHVIGAPAYSGLRRREDLPPSVDSVQQIEVRTERLDDVLADGPIPSLLKIDVEGAEFGVLSGGIETLQRHRPFVLFEHGAGGADLYGTHPNEVFDLLDDAKLRIFDLEGGGPYSREQFEATFAEPIWNFLAAPG